MARTIGTPGAVVSAALFFSAFACDGVGDGGAGGAAGSTTGGHSGSIEAGMGGAGAGSAGRAGSAGGAGSAGRDAGGSPATEAGGCPASEAGGAGVAGEDAAPGGGGNGGGPFGGAGQGGAESNVCGAGAGRAGEGGLDAGQSGEAGAAASGGEGVANGGDGGAADGGESGAPQGAACHVTGQCVAGEMCSGTTEAAICVTARDVCECAYMEFCDRGVCVAIPERGQPCGTGGVCRSQDFCEPVSGLCRALPDLGEACTPSGECRADDTGYACDQDGCTQERPGLYCNAGTCEARPAAGQPCTPDGRCAFEHHCEAGTCERMPRQGELCTEDDRCAIGFECGPDGVCFKPLAPGEPCAGSTTPCSAGHACRPMTGLCEPIPRRGTACDLDFPCVAGGPLCDGARCTICSSSSQCFSSEFCAPWGTCIGRVVPSEFPVNCRGHEWCVDGAFCSTSSGVANCEWLPGPGEVCADARVAWGSPVPSSCAAGAHCRNADDCYTFGPDCVCDPDPGFGESCAEQSCGPGLECVTGYTDGRCE